MLSGFQNISRIPELRRRVFFTLGMLAVYRLGVHVPTPGIDRQAMAAFFDQQRNNLLGFPNLFSGGALEQFSVFSLGIMPYISASIILQLLTVVFHISSGSRKKAKRAGVKSPNTPVTGRSCYRSFRG